SGGHRRRAPNCWNAVCKARTLHPAACAISTIVSGEGHLAAKLQASYDLLLTQRLILQPQIELNVYSKSDPARQVGAGFSDIDTGLRLGYEFSRTFAPYLGVVYEGNSGRRRILRGRRARARATSASSSAFAPGSEGGGHAHYYRLPADCRVAAAVILTQVADW